MVVCVARASGRLGNQLSQYVALRAAVGPDARLLLMRFSALQEACDGVEASFLPSGPNVSRAYTVIRAMARRTAVPFLSTVTEENAVPKVPPGTRLVLTEEIYAQNGRNLESLELGSLRPRQNHDREASAYLTQVLMPGEHPVFVHLRLSDYLTWGPGGQPAAVAPEWIRDRVEELLDSGTKRRVVVVSDEPDVARELLQGVPAVFGRRAVGVDLALMSRCEAGILSPSTLAWWGARFAVALHGAPGPFTAPQWWAGHRSGGWYPPQIETGFLDYR